MLFKAFTIFSLLVFLQGNFDVFLVQLLDQQNHEQKVMTHVGNACHCQDCASHDFTNCQCGQHHSADETNDEKGSVLKTAYKGCGPFANEFISGFSSFHLYNCCSYQISLFLEHPTDHKNRHRAKATFLTTAFVPIIYHPP